MLHAQQKVYFSTRDENVHTQAHDSNFPIFTVQTSPVKDLLTIRECFIFYRELFEVFKQYCPLTTQYIVNILEGDVRAWLG